MEVKPSRGGGALLLEAELLSKMAEEKDLKNLSWSIFMPEDRSWCRPLVQPSTPLRGASRCPRVVARKEAEVPLELSRRVGHLGAALRASLKKGTMQPRRACVSMVVDQQSKLEHGRRMATYLTGTLPRRACDQAEQVMKRLPEWRLIDRQRRHAVHACP